MSDDDKKELEVASLEATILHEELATKRIQRVDLQLQHERRKVLAAREDEQHERDEKWRTEGRPRETREGRWWSAFASSCEGLMFRGVTAFEARAQAVAHADAVMGLENRPEGLKCV